MDGQLDSVLSVLMNYTLQLKEHQIVSVIYPVSPSLYVKNRQQVSYMAPGLLEHPVQHNSDRKIRLPN
jgi:hypothetical protein